MTFKSLISPLAAASILAFSAAPAFAAVYAPEHLVIREHHPQSVNLARLTPAERTALVDQCRQLQLDAQNSVTGDDLGSVNPQFCDAIGIVS